MTYKPVSFADRPAAIRRMEAVFEGSGGPRDIGVCVCGGEMRDHTTRDIERCLDDAKGEQSWTRSPDDPDRPASKGWPGDDAAVYELQGELRARAITAMDVVATGEIAVVDLRGWAGPVFKSKHGTGLTLPEALRAAFAAWDAS